MEVETATVQIPEDEKVTTKVVKEIIDTECVAGKISAEVVNEESTEASKEDSKEAVDAVCKSNGIESDSVPSDEKVADAVNHNEASEPMEAESTSETVAEPTAVVGDSSAAAVEETTTDSVDDSKTSDKSPDTNGEAKPCTEETSKKSSEPLAGTVAKHYNELKEGTKETRKESRIFHLRNFNNWAKSTVINEYLDKVKRRKRTTDNVVVLDMACGKGGDLLKWQKGRVDHLIMTDIASTSIEQCSERYKQLNPARGRRLFNMEAFVADSTKERLAEKYKRKDVKIDLCSCQFAFHYSFESYAQADMMIKNACEKLRVGGFWIGSTPDAYEIVKRAKASENGTFGNSVYNVACENKEQFPLFGAKYMFHLEGVVDCPEFLVYFPVVEKLAEKYGMKLVWKKNFHQLFKSYEKEYSSLLLRMNALEQYPAGNKTLCSDNEEQYAHAKSYLEQKGDKDAKVGTLTKEEWEAAGLYCSFVFEKMSNPTEDTKNGHGSEREERKRSRDRSRDSRRDRSQNGGKDKKSDAKRSRKESIEMEEFQVTDAIECEDEEDDVDADKKTASESAEQKTEVVEEAKETPPAAEESAVVTSNEPDSAPVDVKPVTEETETAPEVSKAEKQASEVDEAETAEATAMETEIVTATAEGVEASTADTEDAEPSSTVKEEVQETDTSSVDVKDE